MADCSKKRSNSRSPGDGQLDLVDPLVEASYGPDQLHFRPSNLRFDVLGEPLSKGPGRLDGNAGSSLFERAPPKVNCLRTYSGESLGAPGGDRLGEAFEGFHRELRLEGLQPRWGHAGKTR